jgi:uncharacterized membrane protein YozB (DUF420 family)
MNVTDQFDDTLEPVGIIVGVALVVIGLTTIAGQPWATKISILPAVVQVVGALATAAIGAGLVWLSRSENSSLADD